MEQIFKSFADLAASVLAERWQKIHAGDQASASQPDGHVGPAAESATVRVTVVDAHKEASAHATVKHLPD
jgi:hypothetical protein